MKKTLIVFIGLLGLTLAAAPTNFVQLPDINLTVSRQIDVAGEFATNIDVTNNDLLQYSLGYMGFHFTGENWKMSLSGIGEDPWDVEEASIRFGMFNVGKQPTLYGNAWPLHRPSQNDFITAPRDQDIQTGVLVGSKGFGVFYNSSKNYSWRIAPTINGLWIFESLTLGWSSTNAHDDMDEDLPSIVDYSTKANLFNTDMKLQGECVDGDLSWIQGSAQYSNLLFMAGRYEVGDEALHETRWGLGYKFGDGYLVYEDGKTKIVSLVVSF